jgi:hypothetical protein
MSRSQYKVLKWVLAVGCDHQGIAESFGIHTSLVRNVDMTSTYEQFDQQARQSASDILDQMMGNKTPFGA